MGAIEIKEMIKETVSAEAMVHVWDAYANAGYGDIHKLPSFRKMDKVLTRMFVKDVRAEVLDAGCGDGTFFESIEKGISPAYIKGADWSPDMLQIAEKNADLLREKGVRAELEQIDLGERLPWANETFDCVVCHMVFCYIPKPWQAILTELLRVTKKGGYLYLTTFLSGWDFSHVVKRHSLGEMFKWPPFIGIYHGLRLKKYPADAIKLAKEAGLQYPSLEGLYNFFRAAGCRDIICEPVFWGAAEAMRAKKT